MPAAASTGARRRLPERRIKPSGTWGVWIDARLKAKVWTQKEAFDKLRARWPRLFPWGDSSLDSFRQYIRGKEPDEEQQAAFLELFGGPPPVAGSKEATPFDPADLYKLLAEQAAAITKLAEAIEKLTAKPAGDRGRGVARVQAAGGEAQQHRERPTPSKRRPRDHTGGGGRSNTASDETGSTAPGPSNTQHPSAR